MAQELEFTLNGRLVQAEGISPNLTLLELLRSRGLTGTKEGCAAGDCGACSVVMAPDFPALADMLRVFGSRQIRNRGHTDANQTSRRCAPEYPGASDATAPLFHFREEQNWLT
jgi:xanthine dehydrogenase iron-sulfur cluster and FAD-binding subunit A